MLDFTAIAHRALAHWGVAYRQLRLITDENNAVFQVDDAYSLRITPHGQRTAAELESELGYLRALGQAGMTNIPQPQAPLFADAHAEGESYAALFQWLDGQVIPTDQHTAEQVRAVAHKIALLHEFTQTHFTPLANFTRPRYDWEGLFGERSLYNPHENGRYISRASAVIFDQVAERTDDAMRQLDTGAWAFGLIHADFIFKNTLFRADGSIAVIDFDNFGWGYWLYDLACPLWFYRTRPDYTALKGVMLQAYTHATGKLHIRMEDHPLLDTFVAARGVASCRWVAAHADHPAWAGRATAVIDARAAQIAHWLASGHWQT